jgi:hypothetical protein
MNARQPIPTNGHYRYYFKLSQCLKAALKNDVEIFSIKNGNFAAKKKLCEK